MRVVFVGATSFGLQCLQSIRGLPEVEISGILSNEENFSISYNKAGVKNVLYTDFATPARELSLPFYRLQSNMQEEGVGRFLSSCRPDLVLVAGWYHLVPKELLSRYRFVGLHASLLPDYSGGAPLVWAMINGEKKTGITFFRLEEGVDSGEIIGQKEVDILDDDTIKTLYAKIEVLGCALLKEQLPRIANGTATYTKQDERRRRVFPQRKPDDGLIDWSWEAPRIRNFIRAQTRPYPGAFAMLGGKKVTIWDADVEPQ